MSLGDFDSWSGPRRWQEWSVTFDGDLRFRRFFHRWKALSLSFPTVKESSKTEITIESYGPFEITQAHVPYASCPVFMTT